MLTLEIMENMELTAVPRVQKGIGVLLGLNYRMPFTRTRVTPEGVENIPRSGPVYLAMNHTDRYNYWPLQYSLWKGPEIYTATWVKGKYYNNTKLRYFMMATNNIPTPSRGYLITCDAIGVNGKPTSDSAYRILRNAIDEGSTDIDAVKGSLDEAGVLGEVMPMLITPRSMLGRDFNPENENWLEAMNHLFNAMMDRFIDLNMEAFDKKLKTIVFPEGTRSRKLLDGKTGLAQMALRTEAKIVPIGCNGSDVAYPGNSPVSKGGELVYRIGPALCPDDELKAFRIQEEYRPFTRQAEKKYAEEFRAVTDLVMNRINDLLDPQYQRDESATAEEQGAGRFI